jgi:hypothetical protein
VLYRYPEAKGARAHITDLLDHRNEYQAASHVLIIIVRVDGMRGYRRRTLKCPIRLTGSPLNVPDQRGLDLELCHDQYKLP